mgnify:CR=1 FL=1
MNTVTEQRVIILFNQSKAEAKIKELETEFEALKD